MELIITFKVTDLSHALRLVSSINAVSLNNGSASAVLEFQRTVDAVPIIATSYNGNLSI